MRSSTRRTRRSRAAAASTAGPELLAACRTIGGCPTGQVRITPGYRLPARHVILAVGPVWQGGTANEAALLAACYDGALALAARHAIRSIAFAAISTGVYGFPVEPAARIAVGTVVGALDAGAAFERVIFACFSERSAGAHRDALLQQTAARERPGPC